MRNYFSFGSKIVAVTAVAAMAFASGSVQGQGCYCVSQYGCLGANHNEAQGSLAVVPGSESTTDEIVPAGDTLAGQTLVQTGDLNTGANPCNGSAKPAPVTCEITSQKATVHSYKVEGTLGPSWWNVGGTVGAGTEVTFGATCTVKVEDFCECCNTEGGVKWKVTTKTVKCYATGYRNCADPNSTIAVECDPVTGTFKHDPFAFCDQATCKVTPNPCDKDCHH